MNKLSVYIEKFNRIHKFRYDYSNNNLDVCLGKKDFITVKCKCCRVSKSISIAAHNKRHSYICSCYIDTTDMWRYKTLAFYITLFAEHYKKSDFDYSNNDFTKFLRLKDKITIRCNNCFKTMQRTVQYHLRGYKCGCRDKSESKYSWNHFLNRINKVTENDFEYLNIEPDKLYTVRDTIIVKCKKCENIKESKIVNHLRTPFCRFCRESKAEKYARLITREFGDLYDYSDTDFSTLKRTSDILQINCTICLYEWSDSVIRHLETGCPFCWNANFVDSNYQKSQDYLFLKELLG